MNKKKAREIIYKWMMKNETKLSDGYDFYIGVYYENQDQFDHDFVVAVYVLIDKLVDELGFE